MLTCKNLSQLPSLQKLTCAAGKKGLNHTIRWTYIAESQTFAQWIHGGELLIVSSAVIQSPAFNLTELISEAIKNKLSGALLLCGENYITEIPPSAIAVADKAGFPLLKISWDVPLVDILEDIGRAILNDNLLTHQGEDIIHHILFADYCQTDFLTEQANLLNYDLTGSQQMLLFYFTAAHTGSQNIPPRETVREYLQSYLTAAALPHLTSAYHNHLIILCRPSQPDQLTQILTDLQTALTNDLPQINFYIGAGSICTQLAKLKTSFNEASKTIQLLHRLKQPNTFCQFSDIGLYGLFSKLDKTTVLEPFIHKTIGKLEEYDTANNAELLTTLTAYLESSGSLSQTAQKLTIHRNTLKYRLTRIEQITQKSLSTAATRLELQTALFIRQLII